MIEVRDLVAGYRHGRRTVPVVNVAALSAAAGYLVGVLGPNGSGKSTLLRTLVGAQSPLSGRVLVDAVPIDELDRHERARRIAVVLTDRIDPGWLTVGDIITLGRHPHTGWRGRLHVDDTRIATGAAERMGVAELWNRAFSELSDGQRQRAMVARALAQEPSVLVLDEPTAFLDVAGRVELTIALADLARDGLAVVVATHDLDLALSHADRVWLVNDGSVVDLSPENLVAGGELTRAFSDGIVEVDAATGTVRARLRNGQPVIVHGRDLDAQLVRRMATRLGANVVEPEEVAAREGGSTPWELSAVDGRWLVQMAGQRHVADDFDSLAEVLRRHLQVSRGEAETRTVRSH